MHRGEMCTKQLISTAIAIAFTLIPMVNAFAHIGGFLFGMCLGFVVFVRGRYFQDDDGDLVKKNYKTYQFCFAFIALGFMLASVFTLVALLLTGENAYDWCPSCEYLECFETPFWDCDSMKVASCAYQQVGDVSPCVNIDPAFNGDTCFVITCEQGSQAAYFEIPTPSTCYDLCGSAGNVC